MNKKASIALICALFAAAPHIAANAASVLGTILVKRGPSRTIISAGVETDSRDALGKPVIYKLAMDENGRAIASQYEFQKVKIEGVITANTITAQTWSSIEEKSAYTPEPEPAPEPRYEESGDESGDEAEHKFKRKKVKKAKKHSDDEASDDEDSENLDSEDSDETEEAENADDSENSEASENSDSSDDSEEGDTDADEEESDADADEEESEEAEES